MPKSNQRWQPPSHTMRNSANRTKSDAHIAKGPGAGMEEGSAAAAKFMADQVNEAIGAAAVPDKPTPGEKEIADKTRELLIAQNAANATQLQELATQKELLTEFRQNKFQRFRF